MARPAAISPVLATGSTGQRGSNAKRVTRLTRQCVADTIGSSPNAARIGRLVAWLKSLGPNDAGDLLDTIEANAWLLDETEAVRRVLARLVNVEVLRLRESASRPPGGMLPSTDYLRIRHLLKA
jgi:hypothetical protein